MPPSKTRLDALEVAAPIVLGWPPLAMLVTTSDPPLRVVLPVYVLKELRVTVPVVDMERLPVPGEHAGYGAVLQFKQRSGNASTRAGDRAVGQLHHA